MPAIPPNLVAESEPNSGTPQTKPASEALAPEHFYMEGPYLVFTAAYHIARGYCCNSDCRHCPYREPAPSDSQV